VVAVKRMKGSVEHLVMASYMGTTPLPGEVS
jgi:hypothetical protein